MREKLKIFYIGLISSLLVLSTAQAYISPTVSQSPPTGQYHPLYELWLNESNIDWLGINFYNLSTVNASILVGRSSVITDIVSPYSGYVFANITSKFYI